MKKILFLITFITVSVNIAFAVPAKPVVINVLQKNGTEISIRLHGDEHFKFKTTEDGVLITENSNGVFEYAKMNENGEISTTGILAKNREFRSKDETSFVQTLNNNVYEITERVKGERIEQKKLNSPSIRANSPTAGLHQKALVILVNFSDKSFENPDGANVAFHNLLNQTGYNLNNAMGSARDYFIASSNSLFQPTFDVYGPYTLPKTLNYYGENDYWGNDKNAEQMILDACTLAYNAGVDFSQYDTDGDGYVDNVFVFYAGYSEASGAPANTIWPHSWQVVSNKNNAPYFGSVRVYEYACSSELKNAHGSEIDGIGTFVHEFSHVLGLPDLYKTNGGLAVNLEQWDVMDAGCYNGPGNNGDVPPHYSAYEMFYMGWLTPEILTESGNYSLQPLESSQKKAFLVAKNNSHNLNGQSPNATEFYMIENRQKTSFDTYLPGSGLLITRINFNQYKWNANTVNNSSPKGVEIMKANNNNNQTGWAFPYSTITGFEFKSTTGSNPNWDKSVSQIKKSGQTMSFNFNSSTTSIKDVENNEFDVIDFPLNWYVSMDYGNYLMEIYAINGILLKTFNFTDEINIAKNNFPNGIYLLKIKDLNNNKSYFSKIIK